MTARRVELEYGARRDWLAGVLSRHTQPETLRAAEVICRHADEDGVCDVPSRVLMAEADIAKFYVWQRSIRHLTDAGDVQCLNPDAPRSEPRRLALLIDGERIAGGDPEGAPRLAKRWGWRVQHEETQRRRARVDPLPEDDDLWMEPMPWCGHTLRECSPACPDWGGRRLDS